MEKTIRGVLDLAFSVIVVIGLFCLLVALASGLLLNTLF